MVKPLPMLVPTIDPAKKNQYVVSADTGAVKAGTGVARPNPYVVYHKLQHTPVLASSAIQSVFHGSANRAARCLPLSQPADSACMS